MLYLIRNKDTRRVHEAVQEGGGGMVILMTKCGLSVRWDLPHPRWTRAAVNEFPSHRDHFTCRKCIGS